MMFALLFALARMASAAWVGAAMLFVLAAVDQTVFIRNSPEFILEKPSAAKDAAEISTAQGATASTAVLVPTETRIRLIAQFSARRFPFYYLTGATLVGVSWLSSLFLRRRYLKSSRWVLVMLLLSGAAGTMTYDWFKVYTPLAAKNAQLLDNPQIAADGEFEALHKHSELVNSAQVLLTLIASLCLCLPGARSGQPTILMTQKS